MSGRVIHRAGERFEGGLGAMMVVVAGEQADVQTEAAIGGEGLQQVRNHLGAQAADARAAQWQIDGRPATATQIDGHLRQGFIERHDGVAKAPDRPALAERLIERLSVADAYVFGRVVLVDVQIALGANGQIEAGMARKAIEHVIEKADARGDVAPPGAIQVKDYFDLALACFAADVSRARGVLHSSVRW